MVKKRAFVVAIPPTGLMTTVESIKMICASRIHVVIGSKASLTTVATSTTSESSSPSIVGLWGRRAHKIITVQSRAAAFLHLHGLKPHGAINEDTISL